MLDYFGKEAGSMKKRAYEAPQVMVHLAVTFETIPSNPCENGFSDKCPGG